MRHRLPLESACANPTMNESHNRRLQQKQRRALFVQSVCSASCHQHMKYKHMGCTADVCKMLLKQLGNQKSSTEMESNLAFTIHCTVCDWLEAA